MWPSVASLARDINPDTSCSRTTDPDMVLSSIPGQDIITDAGGSAGHPDWKDADGSMALGHHDGSRWWPRL